MHIYVSLIVVLCLFLFDVNVYKLSFIQELNLELDNSLSIFIIRCWLSGNRISEYIIIYIVIWLLCLFLFVGLCINCDLFQELNLGFEYPSSTYILVCWLLGTWISKIHSLSSSFFVIFMFVFFMYTMSSILNTQPILGLILVSYLLMLTIRYLNWWIHTFFIFFFMFFFVIYKLSSILKTQPRII